MDLKFRAWDGVKFYSPILYNGLVFRDGRDFEDFIDVTDPVMMFTGFYDKNGQEIFVCDIVRDYDDLKLWTVHLDNGFFWVSDLDNIDTLTLIEFANRNNFCNLDIVGNIHANLELLEAE
jgi:hypothetical protein